MFALLVLFWFFFFKQKTAYEMRISDWSSDVCSSDLVEQAGRPFRLADEPQPLGLFADEHVAADAVARHQPGARLPHRLKPLEPQLQPQRQFLRAGFGDRKSTRLNSSH